jgi:beta-galactosidase
VKRVANLKKGAERILFNEREIAAQNLDRDIFSRNLTYPPYYFKADEFQVGELEAIGFIDGKRAASHIVMTPLKPHTVRLTADCGGVNPKSGKKDAFFVYGFILDKNGTPVPTASDSIRFEISGPGRLIGDNPVKAEAGIVAILVEITGEKGILKIKSCKTGSFGEATVSVQTD